MLIQERVEFDGDPAAIWERLSDIERIPEFWHGTRSLQIIGRESNGQGRETVKARAKFAFGGSGDVEITADKATMTLTSNYTSGPFKGVQIVKIAEKAIEARWDVNFTGVFRLTSSWTGGHFKSGTLHALERLCAKDAPGQKIAQS
ncbi:MAG TPA: SRPBCC family protein [Nitrososphaerales archaeon]|nr:SRPBCC family protein [Nitrososphaerales archaeon]